MLASTERCFYVYLLKDPRHPRRLPFYVGKGTGTRAEFHLAKPDTTQKGARIKTIRDEGHEPIAEIIVDDLSEIDALRIEAELISAFGVESEGGILTNTVAPSGKNGRKAKDLTVPAGAREKAQLGLSLLKEAVLSFVKANPEGVTNADVTNTLGLQSDHKGSQINYLAYSLLGILLRERKIEHREKRYIAVSN